MKNRSTIQTLTFVQTNPDHLYMKLNMPGTHSKLEINILFRALLVHCEFSGASFESQDLV
jgi:hypothetical protein